jgi:ribokinase
MPVRIGVIGSANMDLVAQVPRAPGAGENVRGRDLREIPGGKGANQAVGVARLGAECHFVGKVGADGFGDALRENLRREGVNTTHLATEAGAPSGIALIMVDANGQNSIVVCPGANGCLRPEDVTPLRGELETLDAIVMQLEVPIDTVAAVIALAEEVETPVVLDAGPPLHGAPDELFRVDILTPNEAEASALAGRPVRDLREAESAAREFLSRGAGAVVLKLGEKGALLVTPETVEHFPAHKVQVVDTTAAGDAFTAALAVFRAEGLPLREAVALANCAGALAATRPGAQPSMPTRREVEEFKAARCAGR